MLEVWRAIPGYEGYYEVSDLGNVRGVDRTLTDGRRWRGCTITPKVGDKGHLSVRLCRDRCHQWHGVHRLVLLAFVGPCPAGQEGAHNNGRPGDNRLSNLRWDTRPGNLADREKHGTLLYGERNPKAKLTDAQVSEIFALKSRGVKGVEIAAAMGVTPANVSSILRGKTRRRAAA